MESNIYGKIMTGERAGNLLIAMMCGASASLVEMEVVDAQSSSPDHSALIAVGDGEKGFISGEETPHHLLDKSEDLKGK